MFPVPFHHPFPFALPPLPGSCRFACLICSPAPGRGRRGLTVGLRLRTWYRPACPLRCRRSLAIARSLFPAQSPSGLPVCVSLLPPHRMSGELVKTAPADRSSVKPLQSVPVSCRYRIGCRMGCRMMSPLAARPLCHVPPSSCLPGMRLRDVLSLLALGVRLADALASFLRSVATVPPLSRLAYSPRRSCRWAGRCRAVMFARAIFFFLWDFCAIG